ncbi:MAG: hemolysin family protein [Candidatus Omnitrophota bacterium]
MLVNISLFLIFIILSAFFSGSETAIFSLSDLKLRRITAKYPQGKIIKSLLQRPTRLLSAIVFGNMLVNISLASLATAISVQAWGKNGLVIAVLASGTLILFLGEIFPKTIAIYTAEKLSLTLAPFLNIFSRLFFPFIIAIEGIARIFSSLIIRKPKKSTLSDEEFRGALLLSKKDGQISAQEEKMISHVLEFKDTKASEILTARIDIQGIDTSLNQKDIISFLRKRKHSKFPVYEGSLDNIVGVLYAKDVFLEPDKDYHGFLHKPIFIPESKGIDDILKLFLAKDERIAIVLDEYGGTEGLITVEDIIEEIFGEIYDEFESIQEQIESIEDKRYRVYGKTNIKTVNLELGLNLPEQEDTIAGFLLSQMERIPRSGEKLKFKRVEFTIERATARRIVSVIIEAKK